MSGISALVWLALASAFGLGLYVGHVVGGWRMKRRLKHYASAAESIVLEHLFGTSNPRNP